MRLLGVGLLSLGLWAGLLFAVAYGCQEAKGRVGRAPLFLLTSRFSVRGYLTSAPAESHTLAILWDVPRRRLKNLSAVLQHTPADTVLVTMLNETCVRNLHCEPGDALFGYTQATLRRAAARDDEGLRVLIQGQAKALVASVTPRLEGRKLLLNPLLETSLSASQWDTVAGWIEEAVGDVDLVWNPLRSGAERPKRADVKEVHGFDVSCADGQGVIANLDGSWGSIVKMRNWLEQTKGCRDSLLWVPADNCRSENEKTFIPPSRRTCRQGFGKVKEALRHR